MPHKQRSQVKSGKRGQALVLACLSLLLLALMMLLSFNLSYALRQKTQLQQHSDAMAYSMAVLEARALNYFASSNRAIASSYVAMNNVHGYMAAASVTGEMMGAAKKAFGLIILQEVALCVACKGTCDHCMHVKDAKDVRDKFSDAQDEYREKAKSKESEFNKVVKLLDEAMDSLHKSQAGVFDETAKALADGSSHKLSELRRINAPDSSELNSSVGSLNTSEFNCAIDGKKCSGSGKPANSSNKARATMLAQVANGSRNDWASKRGGTPPKYLNSEFLQKLKKDIQQDGSTRITSHDGTAKTVKSEGELDSDASTGNDGSKSAGHEHGSLISTYKHGLTGIGSYDAMVLSDSSGGEHNPDEAHSGSHQFEGANSRDLASCGGNGNCFMSFRADPSSANDYGQPHVYSYVTQRLRSKSLAAADWQLNDSATLTFKHGDRTGKVTLAADEGAAMSKALVYYHRLGDWSEPPNMFNPFWRAKLHPFTPKEAENVLNEAGNSDAAQLAATPKMPL
ncbi:pilus assembly protein TadG-related protein [Stigmatella sp. ncwal1]|uniref:Pilus assembly protein TadG-related protein n=1 Tax=Stigmatella ashevillensis TaxID=2995309 RepID=A0ABT5DDP8_9BACT|nr:pilus assembly protein TadG-related protein [Stigmatella ashevillena]MDC0711809.1 pilus assembly protein TadG-related protein [Stigmatella ashevillena]